MRMSDSTQLASRAGDRYLLLADISGYTAFMADRASEIPHSLVLLGDDLAAIRGGSSPGVPSEEVLSGLCFTQDIPRRVRISNTAYRGPEPSPSWRAKANPGCPRCARTRPS